MANGENTVDPGASFVTLSALLTGYDSLALVGTGRVEEYLRVVTNVVGTDLLKNLIKAVDALIKAADPSPPDSDSVKAILEDPALGPLARNIIKLWFLGVWYQFESEDWHTDNCQGDNLETHVVSGQAYVEGLVWNDMGTHPQAAKQPGWATWSWEPLVGGSPSDEAADKGGTS